MEVPVAASGLDQEKIDVAFVRGPAARGTDGGRAAGSIPQLWWAAALSTMLVPVSMPVRVVDERCPPGTERDHSGV